jgi:magnesium transporter
MSNKSTHANVELWNDLWQRHEKESLLRLIECAPAIEVAEFLEKHRDHELVLEMLSLLSEEFFGEIFIEFEDDFQIDIYRKWEKRTFAKIFSLIPSQHRADFYRLLNEKEQTKLLPYLTKSIRQDVITLSAYDPDTVGSTMSTDFCTIMCDMNVQKAINKLREDAPSKKMMYYLYVVDHNMRMIGFASLKDLVMSEPDTNVIDCIHENYISANVNDDKELVAQQIEKYDLLAIPILNDEKQLVGILRYDDAMDVIRAEETEDMEKFMGIMPDEENADYTSISVFQHFRKRIVWIVGLFIASFLSEMLIHKNGSILTKIKELSWYLPMIAGAGGNAGSQAATVVIRALSLGQVTLKSWIHIIFKEAQIASLISICLFSIAFAKIMILSSNTDPDMLDIYKLAFAVSLALSLQVVSSAVIGAALPFVAKYFKGDPAVAASPAITTLVDITGVIIYFAVTIRILL